MMLTSLMKPKDKKNLRTRNIVVQQIECIKKIELAIANLKKFCLIPESPIGRSKQRLLNLIVDIFS